MKPVSDDGKQHAIADVTGLTLIVERARLLLDDGDVEAARILAAGAYEQAKAAAHFAKRIKAAEQLVDKARRLQGDALLIEARAKIRLAKEWDAAQAVGAIGKQGQRTDIVPDENKVPTAEDVGLTRKEIHEARKLAEAEDREPGIVERAIAARLAAGFEPSRANLRAAVGTSSATKEDRGNNLYETPIEAMRTLLALESFLPQVWEPSVGRGAILRPLEDAGYEVAISDLIDYGTATCDGELQGVSDFLHTARPNRDFDLVTNPPYGTVMNAYIAHALRAHRPRKMALLLNLNVLAGFDDPDRNFYMDECPPARVYVFTRRLPMMHRDGWTGPEAQSRMNTGWFVWERDSAGSYGNRTIIDRVDWKDFEQTEALPPGSAARALSSGQLLTWRENGQGLHQAFLGDIQFGAISVEPKGRRVRWARLLNSIPGGHWQKAKSLDAAQVELESELREFLDAARLVGGDSAG